MKASRADLHQFEYGVGLASLVILVAGLNILDAIFTQVILATGGAECNPVVRAAMMPMETVSGSGRSPPSPPCWFSFASTAGSGSSG